MGLYQIFDLSDEKKFNLTQLFRALFDDRNDLLHRVVTLEEENKKLNDRLETIEDQLKNIQTKVTKSATDFETSFDKTVGEIKSTAQNALKIAEQAKRHQK